MNRLYKTPGIPSKTMNKFQMKIFAVKFVSNGFDPEAAYEEAFPGKADKKTIVYKVKNLMQNKKFLAILDIAKEELMVETDNTAGKIIKEHWYQYNKYKDDPNKWQAAYKHLSRLGDFVPKMKPKLPFGFGVQKSTVIVLPMQSEVGSEVRQVSFEDIPKDLLPDAPEEEQKQEDLQEEPIEQEAKQETIPE